MNHQKISFLLFAATTLLVACESKDLEIPEPVNRLVPLQLNSSINKGITRVFDTTWEQNDAIGVFTTVAGDATKITKSASVNDENIQYYTTAEQNTYNNTTTEYNYRAFIHANSQIYLPVDGSQVDVYAYYPYTVNVKESSPLSITIPGTTSAQTLAQQKAIDVLKAKKNSTTQNPIDIDNPAVDLLFEHALTKVVVLVMSGTGYSDSDISGNVSNVQLTGQPTVATFAPISQTLSITSGSSTINMQPVTDTTDDDYVTTYNTKNVLYTFRAIILPNGTNNVVTTDSSRQIVFTVGDTDYSYNITQQFEAGHEYIFAVQLSGSGINVTAAIHDWSFTTITPNPLYPN